jgi:DNA polymerase-3 subunit delta
MALAKGTRDLTPLEFKKEIQGKNRKTFYLVRGGDPLARELCHEAAKGLLDEEARAFNFRPFRLEKDMSGEILDTASSRGLFSSFKVVIVKVPDSYKMTADDSENFLLLVGEKNSDSLTVMFWENPDERTKFMKAVKKEAAYVDCPMPDKRGMPAWLIHVFKSQGLTLSPPMANLILERAGDNPGTLVAEAEKLAIFPGPGKALTAKEIKEYVSLGPASLIYELGEPLGERNIGKLVPILLDLLESGEPAPLLTSVGSHLRRLYELKLFYIESQLNGERNPDAATALGHHPFYAKKLSEQASRWTFDELVEALDKAERTHRLLVTSPIPRDVCLENFLFDIVLTAGQKKEVKKSA